MNSSTKHKSQYQETQQERLRRILHILPKEWNGKLFLDVKAPARKAKKPRKAKKRQQKQQSHFVAPHRKTELWIDQENERQAKIDAKCDFCKRNGYVCNHEER